MGAPGDPATGAGTIVLDLEVASRIEDVWAAWVEPDLVSKWLGTRARIEARRGGAYELFWDTDAAAPPGGSVGRITAWNEEYLLGFGWRGPSDLPAIINADPPPTSVIVRFQPLGPNRSRLRLEHSGFGPGPEWDAARSAQETMWKRALEALKSHLVPTTSG